MLDRSDPRGAKAQSNGPALDFQQHLAGRERHAGLGLMHLQRAQVVQAVRHLHENVGAVGRSHARPGPMVERAAGGREGGVTVVGAASTHLGEVFGKVLT